MIAKPKNLNKTRLNITIMVPDIPLQFGPIFRSYLWGGNRLKSVLNKHVPDSGRWAESWELVDHGTDQSAVCRGPWKDWTLRQLIESFPQEILGVQTAEQYKSFPLLLKYLDCNNVLSVQVHPDDVYGASMTPPDLGKTEAWYIVAAEPDAVLYAGLKPNVDFNELERAIEAGQTESCLHVIKPNTGDCLFIPAGTVHALGSGLIVAEIQQASDTTFRLFDWNRVDSDGKSRPLHIDQALRVIDFDRGPMTLQNPQELSAKDGNGSPMQRLVSCDKFQLDRLSAGQHSLGQTDSFAILTVPKGSAELTCGDLKLSLEVGQTAFMPAAAPPFEVILTDGSTVLVASLPQ